MLGCRFERITLGPWNLAIDRHGGLIHEKGTGCEGPRWCFEGRIETGTFRGFIQVIDAQPLTDSLRESGARMSEEPQASIITTKALSKMYGPHLALENINLNINSNHAHLLMNTNSSKSGSLYNLVHH